MRTVEEWTNKIYPQRIKRLTPRIQRDLQKISFPENLPETIESTFIFGKVGSGKTLRAIFLMLEEEKRQWLSMEMVAGLYMGIEEACVFISVPELLNEIKSGFDSAGRTERDIINFYSSVYFLVLDDLGVEKVSDWVLQTLYLIINRRYEHMKKTIITSNCTLEELATRLNDDRIPSRIERMCKLEEKLDYKTKA
jgi:DNA replication protein DnaC